MNDNKNGKLNNKSKRYPREKVFIVNESYAGIKDLSDIFADLLYSEYCKHESEITGNEINPSGYLPTQSGQTQYGNSAY